MKSLHAQSYLSQNLMFKFLLKTNDTKTHLEAFVVAESNPYLLIGGQCLITGRANTACLISNVQKKTQKPDV